MFEPTMEFLSSPNGVVAIVWALALMLFVINSEQLLKNYIGGWFVISLVWGLGVFWGITLLASETYQIPLPRFNIIGSANLVILLPWLIKLMMYQYEESTVIHKIALWILRVSVGVCVIAIGMVIAVVLGAEVNVLKVLAFIGITLGGIATLALIAWVTINMQKWMEKTFPKHKQKVE